MSTTSAGAPGMWVPLPELPREVRVRCAAVVLDHATDEADARLLVDMLMGPVGPLVRARRGRGTG